MLTYQLRIGRCPWCGRENKRLRHSYKYGWICSWCNIKKLRERPVLPTPRTIPHEEVPDESREE